MVPVSVALAFSATNSLPVKLISFTGTYKSNAAFLNWEAESQVNFSGYEIEKSTDGIHFEGIASKSRQGTGSDREFYNYMDDLFRRDRESFFLPVENGRLMDGKFTYSNIIVLRKDGIKTGISISPNPVVSGGLATARIEASKKGTIEIEILDMAGRIVLRQQNQVFEGTNSIALNQLAKVAARHLYTSGQKWRGSSYRKALNRPIKRKTDYTNRQSCHIETVKMCTALLFSFIVVSSPSHQAYHLFLKALL